MSQKKQYRKNIITVFDDFLTEKENIKIIEYYHNQDFSPYIIDPSYKIPFYCQSRNVFPLIDRMIDAVYFDFYDGFEAWWNPDQAPSMHFDYDIVKRHESGEIVHPNFSIVYYPFVDIEDGGGGLVISETAIIESKTRRLIAFDSSLAHGVSDFTGRRLSLAVNIWKQKPLGTEAVNQKVSNENQPKESMSSQQF